jgi:hypothetical protein
MTQTNYITLDGKKYTVRFGGYAPGILGSRLMEGSLTGDALFQYGPDRDVLVYPIRVADTSKDSSWGTMADLITTIKKKDYPSNRLTLVTPKGETLVVCVANSADIMAESLRPLDDIRFYTLQLVKAQESVT